MEIIVWGNTKCSKCKALHRMLDKRKIKHEYIMGSNEELLNHGRKAGTTTLPISFINGEYKRFSAMLKFINDYGVK